MSSMTHVITIFWFSKNVLTLLQYSYYECAQNAKMGWNIQMWTQLANPTQRGPYLCQEHAPKTPASFHLMLSRAHLLTYSLHTNTHTHTLNRPAASCLSRQGLTSASFPLLSYPSQSGKPGIEYKVNTVLSFSLSWSSSTLCHPYPNSPPGAPGLTVLFL